MGSIETVPLTPSLPIELMNCSASRRRRHRAPSRLRHLTIATLLTLCAAPAFAQVSGRVQLPPLQVSSPSSPSRNFEAIDRTVEDVRYLVYIDSSRESRLREVQSFYSSAMFGDLSGDRVIQVGLFEFEADASDRQITLIGRGFDAEVARVKVRRSERTASPEAAAPFVERAYYVVIPEEDTRELETLAASLQALLGVPVAIRSEPLGTHAAIGPFGQRDDAEDIADLLQERDIDNARVHYERGSLLEELF